MGHPEIAGQSALRARTQTAADSNPAAGGTAPQNSHPAQDRTAIAKREISDLIRVTGSAVVETATKKPGSIIPNR